MLEVRGGGKYGLKLILMVFHDSRNFFAHLLL